MKRHPPQSFLPLMMISFAVLALTACLSGAGTTPEEGAPAEATRLPSTSTPLPPPSDPTAPATTTHTPTPSQTVTPSQTPTPPPTLTPTWAFNEAGEVIAPILLYHHIAGNGDNRYYVSPERFREQMKALHDWGYTAIPMSLLLEALINGAELPPRPIVITFDDGHTSVFENAFPIMQEYGFTGVFYIVSNRLKADGFVNADQLKEMTAAGWEIGSHSQSHIDLPSNHDLVHAQIRQSKLTLEEALGVEVQTFAYPYGTIDPYVAQKVQDYGYKAAVGLGKSWKHTMRNLYYLERIEIYGNYTLDDLATRLPWGDEE